MVARLGAGRSGAVNGSARLRRSRGHGGDGSGWARQLDTLVHSPHLTALWVLVAAW